jgi:hypothetical protein
MFRGKLLLLVLACCAVSWYVLSREKPAVAGDPGAKGPVENYSVNRLRHRAGQMKAYARANGYNTHTCFIADLRLHSGQERFFIYDLDRDSVLGQGMVTHGRCNQRWLEGRKYANEPGCGCSSLGKYRIGKAYQGRFGLAYKLHGLDQSNSNAYQRFVVLHAHECVPENAVYPDPICQSDGCPTVSPLFLQRLSHILDQSAQPVLLLLFDE